MSSRLSPLNPRIPESPSLRIPESPNPRNTYPDPRPSLVQPNPIYLTETEIGKPPRVWSDGYHTDSLKQRPKSEAEQTRSDPFPNILISHKTITSREGEFRLTIPCLVSPRLVSAFGSAFVSVFACFCLRLALFGGFCLTLFGRLVLRLFFNLQG